MDSERGQVLRNARSSSLEITQETLPTARPCRPHTRGALSNPPGITALFILFLNLSAPTELNTPLAQRSPFAFPAAKQ